MPESLRGVVIPDDVKVRVTRNYGESAGEKANELIEHLLIATLSVIALSMLAMGWRGSALPSCKVERDTPNPTISI